MTASEILRALPNLSALVVGDICLDRWCTYDPALSEPSRETGIPRLAVVSTVVTPGAGGTVASNLAALGVGRIAVLGAVGNDGFGLELSEALKRRRIDPDLLIRVPDLQTFTYTKLIHSRTGVEDQPRVDFVSVRPMDSAVEQTMVESLREFAHLFDVILISDQAETEYGGVVTAAVREAIADLASKYPRRIFWVDSRLRAELFRNVILKPNHHEAQDACRRLLGRTDYPALRRHIGTGPLLVTHGSEGVLVVDDQGEHWVRTTPVESPVDICGAGDSFSAGAAMALRVTGSAHEAARFGNLVASVTIMKKGTGTASPDEVLDAERRQPL